MFWGLIMEPNKRYTQVVDKPFHISQAAMDTSTGDVEPCQVMVVVDNKNFLICTLQKTKNIQVPLDLYFKTGDSVSFLTNGKCNVHLTGYLDPEFEDEIDDEQEEEEEDDEEEVPALVPAKNKRKNENNTETSASKKAKKNNKKPAAEESSDEDDDDQLQKFLDGEEIDTDDNDESFKVNTSADGEDDSDEEEDDDEEEADEEEDDDEEEESEDEKNTSAEPDTTLDTSKEDVDMSKLSKNQKRRLKKKLAQQAKEKPQLNGVDKKKPEEKAQKAEKKKPEEKKEKQEPAEKKEKKSLSGGVSIEDTKVGNGPPAKPGKVVMVYYEGRLKSNNKMFDNCQKGPGFKFRLGAKEVISGWDVGINGMKVGGKRRITCPPNMAYGAKGSPPVIPPNSTLVFDVELKNVK